uniref:Uncharacterized protein n=1 Tax=Rousettus aegyptiacus TaxID=9407 RepID=A0A7J8GBT0_ROUAE|nr:hypothetical protein HJG63_011805 [Rousettus aegyptiacus]
MNIHDRSGVYNKIHTRWHQNIYFYCGLHSVILKMHTGLLRKTKFMYTLVLAQCPRDGTRGQIAQDMRCCVSPKIHTKWQQKKKKIITTFPGVLFFKCARDSTTFFPVTFSMALFPSNHQTASENNPVLTYTWMLFSKCP